MNEKRKSRGFTLIELMVSVGLLPIVMTLVSGAYIVMLNITHEAQDVSTAVDSVAFALEYMTREIRTGSEFSCSTTPGSNVDCASGGSTFSVKDQSGANVTFTSAGEAITENGTVLTDPSVVVSSLVFYAQGTAPYSVGQNTVPANVVIVVSGTVATGHDSVPFTVETSATMRNIDL